MYRKDPYINEEASRPSYVLKQPAINHPVQRQERDPNLIYESQAQYAEKQPSRDYEQSTYRYDSTNYVDQFSRGYDPRLHYDDRVPPYEEHWTYYEEKQPYNQTRTAYENQPPRDLDSRQNLEESTERSYYPAQPRFEEPPAMSYDGRPRYEHAPKNFSLPQVRYEDQHTVGYDTHGRYKPEAQPYQSAISRSPEPKQYFDPHIRGYEQGPPQAYNAKAGQYEPSHSTSGVSLPPPPSSQTKPEVLPSNSKPLPTPPSLAEEEEDPAMKPQSVRSRVKIFERRRSPSLEKMKDTSDTSTVKVSRLSFLVPAFLLNEIALQEVKYCLRNKALLLVKYCLLAT